MSDMSSSLPNLAEILGPVLRRVPAEQRPLLIAAAERLAANRYRQWADQVGLSFKAGMLACAEREDDIAERVEAMFSNATHLQKQLLAQAPELAAANRLFVSLSLQDQFALQAQGERAGASTWRAYAERATDTKIRDQYLCCARLEEESAEYLESLL